PEWPLVYWWKSDLLHAYTQFPLIGHVHPGRQGANVGDNTRFIRNASEVAPPFVPSGTTNDRSLNWAPFIKGAAGKAWFEPLVTLIRWADSGLEVKSRVVSKFGDDALDWKVSNSRYYFQLGVAFSMIGSHFSARAHRYPGVFGNAGSSVFPKAIHQTLCSMNCTRSRRILESLNPTVNFMVGDVNRLPLFPIAQSSSIFATVESSFTTHESHREPSVEFKRPGPSPWRHAQDWAQLAVDRPEDAPLPPYEDQLDPEPPTDHISYALGIALG